MKRVIWWTLFGLAGTGLAALMVGPTVLGQPQYREPAPIALPQRLPEAPPDGPRSGMESPRPLDLPGGQYPGVLPAPVAPLAPPPGSPTSPMPVGAPPAKLPVDNEPPLFGALASPERPMSSPAEVHAGRQSPSLSIEWAAPTTIRIHQPMACQILVRNTSTVALHNVVVRHRLADGVACKASEPQVRKEGGDLVWDLGALAPEQSRRIEMVLVAPARGVLHFQATATFTAVAGHQVQVREPLLAVKLRAPEKAIAGDTVNLWCEILNPGDGVAEGVKLKTILPDGLEHSSGRKIIEFDVGNLPPRETRKVQLPCVAREAGVQQCKVTVVGEGNLAAHDEVPIEILIPKLDVVLSGPKLRYLDRHAVYVLKVTNPGSAPATGVEVRELVPNGFRFHQASHGGQYQETTRLVSWNVGDLLPGQSKDIAVDLIPVEVGEHRLLAHAKSARGLKTEVETLTRVEGLPSLLIDVGHVDDPIEVGAETVFEIRVANTGTKTEANVEVVCVLPEQLEFKGAECKAGLAHRLEGRELIFEPLPRLAQKADVLYRVRVRGIAPGDVRFRTRIRSEGVREPLLREESMRVYSDDGPTRQNPTAGPTPMPIVVPASNNTPAPPPSGSDPVVPPLPFPTPGGIPAPTPGPLPIAPTHLPPLPSSN